MDPILQRATAECHSMSAGTVPVVKDLHSSAIKVSIVSSDWSRGKINLAILFSEPLGLSENISPLSRMYSRGWFQLFKMPPPTKPVKWQFSATCV